MANKKLEIGQKLYKENGNEVTVSKVGNKYFEIQEMKWKKFIIDNLFEVSEYSTKIQLYQNRQEILDKSERKKLIDFLEKRFSWSSNKNNITLDQLRQIYKILNPESCNQDQS